MFSRTAEMEGMDGVGREEHDHRRHSVAHEEVTEEKEEDVAVGTDFLKSAEDAGETISYRGGRGDGLACGVSEHQEGRQRKKSIHGAREQDDGLSLGHARDHKGHADECRQPPKVADTPTNAGNLLERFRVDNFGQESIVEGHGDRIAGVPGDHQQHGRKHLMRARKGEQEGAEDRDPGRRDEKGSFISLQIGQSPQER